MKNRIIILLITLSILTFSCNTMDLNPLSEGASGNWYSNNVQVRMSLDYLYKLTFWNANPDPDRIDLGGWNDAYSDDVTCRNNLSPVTAGTINGQSPVVVNWWKYYYQCIAAANLALEKIEKNKANFTTANYDQYTAEARFVRAAQYSRLIFFWGDVPYYENTLTIDQAFAQGRTNKTEILKKIYADFDYAASKLPLTYSGTQYATKGAALALKARIALFMGDYSVARDAAKACIDLGIYELEPDFSTLFLSKTKTSKEIIFAIPRSVANNVYTTYYITMQPMSRNASGVLYIQPSWDLFCSFLCKDGLPIDESPLYNPQTPFKNRDPRCTATIVEFGTEWCGTIYQPHPDSLYTKRVSTGARISNLDCRSVDPYASFNGLALRKGIDQDWWDDQKTDPVNIVIRYADVLEIYAEAKIELNVIDQSVLDAMNKVRARAYKVNYTAVSSYPAIITTNQTALRKTLRIERRMEFAWEGLLRHDDIIRWKLAEKVLNKPIYGMIDPPDQREKIVKPGLWFFPEVVPIDEDGVADFTSMFNHGYCKILALRSFDKNKNYLFPLPTTDILINKNLTQNPGY